MADRVAAQRAGAFLAGGPHEFRQSACRALVQSVAGGAALHALQQYAVDYRGVGGAREGRASVGHVCRASDDAGSDRCAVLPAIVGIAAEKISQAAPVKTIRRYVAAQ